MILVDVKFIEYAVVRRPGEATKLITFQSVHRVEVDRSLPACWKCLLSTEISACRCGAPARTSLYCSYKFFNARRAPSCSGPLSSRAILDIPWVTIPRKSTVFEK